MYHRSVGFVIRLLRVLGFTIRQHSPVALQMLILQAVGLQIRLSGVTSILPLFLVRFCPKNAPENAVAAYRLAALPPLGVQRLRKPPSGMSFFLAFRTKSLRFCKKNVILFCILPIFSYFCSRKFSCPSMDASKQHNGITLK